MIIEVGKCYTNSEVFDGKNKICGPIKRYGSMYTDEKGFVYYEDGRILDVGLISWNARACPEKNLVEQCDCEVKKGK